MKPKPFIYFTPIPILSSNFVWAISNSETQEVYIVDPGDAEPVIGFLKESKLRLKGVLITHSHSDHIGGVHNLLQFCSVPVWGPKCDKIVEITNELFEGDLISLWPSVEVSIMHLPGHLDEHIAYFIPHLPATPPALLCGDVLFSSGCGRMFAGPASAFKHSLDRIKGLPLDTQIYCAHEYTLANIEFAKQLEPNNQELNDKRLESQARIDKQACSLPTNLECELKTNPFLRCDSTEIRELIQARYGQKCITELETFIALRKLKDDF